MLSWLRMDPGKAVLIIRSALSASALPNWAFVPSEVREQKRLMKSSIPYCSCRSRKAVSRTPVRRGSSGAIAVLNSRIADHWPE